MTKAYNAELCDEKHENIGKEFGAVWKRFETHGKRIDNFDRKLWGIIILLVLNFGAVSIVGILLKSLSATVNGR